HYNRFWFDRAAVDPAIRFSLIRAGPRGGLAGCIAFGPHEAIDGDPSSRVAGIGEIYHIVIAAARAGRGIGTEAICRAITLMRTHPALTAARVGHHPNNQVAARLYDGLGFRIIGEKLDAESGIRDVLREVRFD